jgi:hypothetical protein
MAGSNLSTKPVSGTRWISHILLNTSDETITPVAAGTSVYIEEVTGACIAGASSAGLVPFSVEEAVTADVCAAGCAQMNGGNNVSHPDATQNGIVVRAGTVAGTASAWITVKYMYRGGTAITEV